MGLRGAERASVPRSKSRSARRDASAPLDKTSQRLFKNPKRAARRPRVYVRRVRLSLLGAPSPPWTSEPRAAAMLRKTDDTSSSQPAAGLQPHVAAGTRGETGADPQRRAITGHARKRIRAASKPLARVRRARRSLLGRARGCRANGASTRWAHLRPRTHACITDSRGKAAGVRGRACVCHRAARDTHNTAARAALGQHARTRALRCAVSAVCAVGLP